MATILIFPSNRKAENTKKPLKYKKNYQKLTSTLKELIHVSKRSYSMLVFTQRLSEIVELKLKYISSSLQFWLSDFKIWVGFAVFTCAGVVSCTCMSGLKSEIWYMYTCTCIDKWLRKIYFSPISWNGSDQRFASFSWFKLRESKMEIWSSIPKQDITKNHLKNLLNFILCGKY